MDAHPLRDQIQHYLAKNRNTIGTSDDEKLKDIINLVSKFFYKLDKPIRNDWLNDRRKELTLGSKNTLIRKVLSSEPFLLISQVTLLGLYNRDKPSKADKERHIVAPLPDSKLKSIVGPHAAVSDLLDIVIPAFYAYMVLLSLSATIFSSS
jgi:hypothetical protein